MSQRVRLVPEILVVVRRGAVDRFRVISESFAGDADLFEFQWVAMDPPTDGTVPTLPSGDPSMPCAQENGLTRLRIGGQGATLRDLVNRFFTVRYRAVSNSPAETVVGTGWSDYCWNS